MLSRPKLKALSRCLFQKSIRYLHSVKLPVKIPRPAWQRTSQQFRMPGSDDFESYAIPGQYDHLTLDLYNYRPGETRPLVIYLPSIPSSINRTRALSSSDEKAASHAKGRRTWRSVAPNIPPYLSEFTVARINWTAGKAQPYPSPYYQCRHALESLGNMISLTGRKIGLHGKYLGGQLAASLALSGPISGFPTTFSAVAVHGAVLDWTGLATSVSASHPDILRMKYRTRRTRAFLGRELTIQHMVECFKSPADCFSPIASPLLFFRKPSVEVPSTFPEFDLLAEPPLPYVPYKSMRRSWLWEEDALLLLEYPLESEETLPRARFSFVDLGEIPRQAEEMADLWWNNLRINFPGLSLEELDSRCLLVDESPPPEEFRSFQLSQHNRKVEQSLAKWLKEALNGD